jgi:hypothetical protein
MASEPTDDGFHDEVERVTIRTFSYRDSAELARSNLEAHGIQCWVNADDCGGMYLNLTAANGVRLVVFTSDAEEAAAILESPLKTENLIAEGEREVKSDEPVSDLPKFIIVAGIWTIYGMGLIGNILVFTAAVSGRIRGLQGLIYFWLSIACGAFCCYMLYRVIRNYIIHKRRSQRRP